MQIRIVNDAPGSVRAGALVVPIYLGTALEGAAKEIDSQLQGAIAEVLAGEISGKFGEVSLIHAHDKPFKRVLLIGLGDAATFEPSMLARYAGTAVRYLGRRNVRDVAVTLPSQVKGREAECASLLVEGAISGSFDATMYQKTPEKRSGAETFTILAGGCDEKALQLSLIHI